MSANSAAAWPIEMVSPSSAQTLRDQVVLTEDGDERNR